MTKDDLFRITKRKRAEDQKRVLISNGIKFTVDADNHPVLTFEAYNMQVVQNSSRVEAAPDFSRI